MPAMPGVLHNWKTAEPFVSAMPQWVQGLDQNRIASYALYDSMFQNAPDTWKVAMYETNRFPIYVPSAKILINTINRYVAPNLSIIPDPLGVAQPTPENLLALSALFKREKFYAKFASEKRMGLVRGDWVFMIQGDLLRPEGTRLSLLTVDPGSYFPIWSEEDPEVRVGAHIATQWQIEDDVFIFRTTFRKVTPEGVIGGPGQITVEEAIFKIDEWGGPEMKEGKPEQVIMALTPLDPRITEIPLYHFRNAHRNGEDYGTSELAGLETLMMSVNQGASDEDIALALAGLGVYWSNAGAPLDPDTGAELPWQIGPTRVVEVPVDHDFGRVVGISSVQPYQDHLHYIDDKIKESAGVSQIAQGRVDVSVAESGIALSLELAPTLSEAEEKELEITAVLENFLWDLRAWMEVYEGVNFGEATFIPRYGDKIPLNRKQRFDELMQLFAAGVVSAEYLRTELVKIGYEMPDEAIMAAQILAEKTANMQIVADVTGSRIDAELAPPTNGQLPADATAE